MDEDTNRESWMEFYNKIESTKHMGATEVRMRFQGWLDTRDRFVSVAHWGMFPCG